MYSCHFKMEYYLLTSWLYFSSHHRVWMDSEEDCARALSPFNNPYVHKVLKYVYSIIL